MDFVTSKEMSNVFVSLLVSYNPTVKANRNKHFLFQEKKMTTLREFQQQRKRVEDLIVQASTVETPDGWQQFPIGMSFHFDALDSLVGPHDRTVLCAVRPLTDHVRRATSPVNRESILSTLRSNGIENVELGRDYFKELTKHKFVISPEGNGADCHRHYEALIAGCIPVMERNPLLMMKYRGLPVLWTTDYSEITIAHLESEYCRMIDQTYDFDTLFLSHYSEELQHEIKRCGNWWMYRLRGVQWY